MHRPQSRPLQAHLMNSPRFLRESQRLHHLILVKSPRLLRESQRLNHLGMVKSLNQKTISPLHRNYLM